MRRRRRRRRREESVCHHTYLPIDRSGRRSQSLDLVCGRISQKGERETGGEEGMVVVVPFGPIDDQWAISIVRDQW